MLSIIVDNAVMVTNKQGGEMKATNQQINAILKQLTNALPVARQSRDRNLMRETVMRIRQLRGILEVRSMKAAVR